MCGLLLQAHGHAGRALCPRVSQGRTRLSSMAARLSLDQASIGVVHQAGAAVKPQLSPSCNRHGFWG